MRLVVDHVDGKESECGELLALQAVWRGVERVASFQKWLLGAATAMTDVMPCRA
jgi:hypothetical protein